MRIALEEDEEEEREEVDDEDDPRDWNICGLFCCITGLGLRIRWYDGGGRAAVDGVLVGT